MKIKMLRSCNGSEDGFTVKHFEQDDVYEITDALGDAFVKDGVAEAVEGEKAEAASANKAVAKAPKNKAEAAPENK